MPGSGCLSEAFLEQSACCSWVFNSEGRFQRIYGESCSLFGKTPPELTGQSIEEALEGEQAILWSDRFRRALSGEALLLRERREERSMILNLFPFTFGGERYVGGSAREITLWNAAEQEFANTVLSSLKAQEFERRMVARFLHDKVGQNLTALGLQLDIVRMDLQPDASARLADIQAVLEEMMQDVREYSYELNPSMVERAGLRPALDRLATRIRGRFAGSLRVNADPSLKVDPQFASALYNIAQEAVENAVKHSGCSTIEIAVKSTRTGPVLEVRDNGRGFDPAEVGAHRGLGLLSMDHYAAQAGLDLSIRSSRGAGATVRAAPPEE